MSVNSKFASPDEPWPPTFIGWYVVVVLALANAVSFLDRLVMSLLIPQIKADLFLSDTQISLLLGFAFSITYGLFGLLIARMADAKSRKYIIMAGIAFWSFATAACGLGRNFWQIFIARIGVGIGEASLSPSAYSMLADHFPPKKLALPVGVFTAGLSAGIGLSLILGAAAIDFASSLGTVTFPLIGPLSDWRLVFVMVGSLGIIPVLFLFTIREPKRRGISSADQKQQSVPLRDVWAYIKKNWRIYLFVFVGYGATSVSIYGILFWTPVFYIRSYGLLDTEAGYLIGLVSAAGGLSGAFFGGFWSDWLERRGDENAKLRVLMYCCLGLIPAGVFSPLMPTYQLALAFLFFSFFFGTAAAGPAGSFVQIITPNRMRAQAGAAYQLSLNLVGAGLGPFAVAVFTDYFFGDEAMVRYSIVIVVAIFNPIAFLLTWRAFRLFPKVKDQLVSGAAQSA